MLSLLDRAVKVKRPQMYQIEINLKFLSVPFAFTLRKER